MWYYAINGVPNGPLDEQALDQLIANGTITSSTPVWKEGMAEWTPLEEVQALKKTAVTVADSAASTCSICKKNVGADNLIDLMGVRVCAACKPMAVQTLREGAPLATGDSTAWRDGKKVVTNDQNTLPPRCYKCNQAVSSAPLKRKLYWHPVGYYLLIFVSVIIYVLVAIIVRKKASIEVYLCDHHLQRRKYFMIGGWTGSLLGVVLFIVGAAENMSIMIISGCVLFLAALIAGVAGSQLARATRIKNNQIWLGGANKEFLASLPPWTV